MLSDAEADEIRAGLAEGLGGPIAMKWVRQLLADRDARTRRQPAPNAANPRSNGGRAKWENVVVGVAGRRDPQELTQRLRVPGGSLYRTIIRGRESKSYAVSLCFVPEGRTR